MTTVTDTTRPHRHAVHRRQGAAQRSARRTQGPRREDPRRALRRRPDARADRGHPAGLGLGPRLARRDHRGRVLLHLRPRHQHGLPPLLHPRLVQGQHRPAVALAIAGSLAIEGPVLDLGRRPPPAPQVQRPGRRPALAVAVRRRLEGTDQGPGLGAHRLDVRRQSHLAAEVLPRPAGRQEDRQDLQALPGPGRRHAARPGADRRPVVLVLAGRADRVLLGAAWSGSLSCTT